MAMSYDYGDLKPCKFVQHVHTNTGIHTMHVPPQKAEIKTYHSVLVVQMKNWDPFVLGPALAMDKMPTNK